MITCAHCVACGGGRVCAVRPSVRSSASSLENTRPTRELITWIPRGAGASPDRDTNAWIHLRLLLADTRGCCEHSAWRHFFCHYCHWRLALEKVPSGPRSAWHCLARCALVEVSACRPPPSRSVPSVLELERPSTHYVSSTRNGLSFAWSSQLESR